MEVPQKNKSMARASVLIQPELQKNAHNYQKENLSNIRMHLHKGQILRNLPEGQGIEFYKTGVMKYDGEFKGGLYDGYGKKYFSNNLLEYKGYLKADKYHGKGVLYGKDGKILYKGQFFNDKYHGLGRIYTLDGLECTDGAFYNGQPQEDMVIKTYNKRVEYYPNNKVQYQRFWADNSPDGDGIERYQNFNIKYDGEFKTGKYCTDFGTFNYENGNIMYEGGFSEDSFNGIGTLYFLNGSKQYEGNFKDGKFHGQGMLYSDECMETYNGEFKEGKKCGRGKLHNNFGFLVYDGEFLGDRIGGVGKEYYPDLENSGCLKYHGEFRWYQELGQSLACGQGEWQTPAGVVMYQGGFDKGFPEGMGT